MTSSPEKEAIGGEGGIQCRTGWPTRKVPPWEVSACPSARSQELTPGPGLAVVDTERWVIM